MPTPPSRTLQNTVTPMAKGGGSPRQTKNLPSAVSLSKFSFSGQRAGATSRGSSTTPRSVQSTANDENEKQPWMETATPGKFDVFQTKIFPIIEYLTAKPEHANHVFTKRWMKLKRTPNTPMTVDITWRNLKILLGIKTMFEYRDFLTQCPEFHSAIKLQNSKTTRSGFDFGIYSSYKVLLSSPTSSQEKSLSTKSNVEDESYAFDIDVNSSDIGIPDETITTPTEKIRPSTKAGAEMTLIGSADHKVSRSKTTDVSNTPRKSNLTVPKEVIQRDVNHIEDTDGSITTDGLAELADLTADISWVNTVEMKLTDQLNRVTSTLAASATKHYNSLTEYASSALEIFQSNVSAYTEKLMTMQQTKLKDMHAANHLKIKNDFREAEEAFHARLEQAMERAIQELLTTADEATDSMNAQAEHLFQQESRDHFAQQCSTSWKYENPKPSKMFPNVDVSQFMTNSTSIRPTSVSDGNGNNPWNGQDVPPPVEWDKDGPHIVAAPKSRSTYTEGLPPVNNHDFLKRVQLPYPGKEQSYIWYLQLRSNAEQYGVFLIATEHFKKNKSLCPTEVNGYEISVARYNTMKCTLYHFLAQRSTISPDQSDLRNIINRQALTTDGYRALYDIMQRVHPALNSDAKFGIPLSSAYNDVHEYYSQFTSYIMHEQFAGRLYKPREQLLRFLEGLDVSFAPAISRIRTQLDNWKTEDALPPENLQLANIPNLIDQYMEESGAADAVIRRFTQKPSSQRPQQETSKDGPTNEMCSYVDMKCPLCQSFGHQTYNCDRMAVWLNLKEGSKLVDEKLRRKLQANYAEIDAKRRTKKLNKVRGTVRQLYQNGQFHEGEQLLDKAFSYIEQSSDATKPDPSDSENSQDS